MSIFQESDVAGGRRCRTGAINAKCTPGVLKWQLTHMSQSMRLVLCKTCFATTTSKMKSTFSSTCNSKKNIKREVLYGFMFFTFITRVISIFEARPFCTGSMSTYLSSSFTSAFCHVWPTCSKTISVSNIHKNLISTHPSLGDMPAPFVACVT